MASANNRRLQRRARDLSARENISYQTAIQRLRDSDAPRPIIEYEHSGPRYSIPLPFGFTDMLPGASSPSAVVPVGAQGGQLAQIVGFADSGSTEALSQSAIEWSQAGYRCLYVDFGELPSIIKQRMVSQIMDLPANEAIEYINSTPAAPDEPCSQVFENIEFADVNAIASSSDIKVLLTLLRSQNKQIDILILNNIQCLPLSDSNIKLTPNKELEAVIKELVTLAKTEKVFAFCNNVLVRNFSKGKKVHISRVAGSIFSDYVFTAWRPETQFGLDDTEVCEMQGQFKVELAKNRLGQTGIKHLWFDTVSLRILPPMEILPPTSYGWGLPSEEESRSLDDGDGEAARWFE